MATDSTSPIENAPESPKAIEPPRPASPAHRRRVRISRATTVLSLIVVIVVAVFFGLSFGFVYGLSNQNSYLVEGLKLFDGSLTKDWYTSQTKSFHFAFAYVVWGLFKISRSGWPFAVANVIANAGCAVVVYWLARSLMPRRHALAAYVLVMAIACGTQTNGANGSYIVSDIFQPSTLGAVGLLAAVVYFLRGQWLASGICLALAGLFHSNYLLLGLGVLTLAQLVLGKKDLFRRLLRQIGPAIPILLVYSPLILKGATDPMGAAARDLLFNIRSPHHFSPKTFEGAIASNVAWMLSGLGAGGYLLRGEGDKARRLGACLLALLGVVWGGTVMIAVLKSQSFQQLFVWRVTPISDLLFQLMLCAGVVRAVARPSSVGGLERFSPRSALLVVAGAGILGTLWGNRNDRTSIMLLRVAVCMLAAVVLALIVGSAPLARALGRLRGAVQRKRMWPVLAGSIVVCASFALLPSFKAISFRLRGLSASERDLCGWVAANSPKEALFLIPPDMETFRLHAARAIVVDWKSPPFLPTEIMEWYRRINDLSGKRVTKRADLAGYADMDASRAEKLYQRYKFDYIVVHKNSKLARSNAFATVWHGTTFAVLDAHSPGGPAAVPAPAPSQGDVDPVKDPAKEPDHDEPGEE